jgi:dsRNA-specific ribonuclease
MYLRLAARPDFRRAVEDMLERTGLPEESVRSILYKGAMREEVVNEFAKCFVPKVVDPVHNYELYEFLGDTFVNSATISYLGRTLFRRLTDSRSPDAVGYLDKLKSACVSTPFLANISVQIGFASFLMWVFSESGAPFDSTKEKNYQEDIVEAFFGCLVMHIDNLEMGRGYYFASNMMTDLLDNIHINYDPWSVWTAPILLKQTNDAISKRNREGARLSLFEIEKRGGGFAVVEKRDGAFVRVRHGPTQGPEKQVKTELAQAMLKDLQRDGAYRGLVDAPPSAESLGISDLIRR